jgi:hypothetical protein
MVERLPVGFMLDARGIRSPLSPVILSFLPLGVELEIAEPQWQPLRWGERNFVWIIGSMGEVCDDLHRVYAKSADRHLDWRR